MKAAATRTAAESGWSPLMRQYFGAKAEHPGDVLLFRMGDFWETFFDDAHTLSRVAGVALTSRGVERGEPVPLAGVPLASFETTVRKLVAAGLRVAICDQVEDPKAAKGLVRREVVEVVSAGTVALPGFLDERVGRYLLAIAGDAAGERMGLARCDITTGELAASEIPTAALRDEIDRIAPAEILVAESGAAVVTAAADENGVAITRVPDAHFPGADESARLVDEGPGFAPGHGDAARFQPNAVRAAAALLRYLGHAPEGRARRALSAGAGRRSQLDDSGRRHASQPGDPAPSLRRGDARHTSGMRRSNADADGSPPPSPMAGAPAARAGSDRVPPRCRRGDPARRRGARLVLLRRSSASATSSAWRCAWARGVRTHATWSRWRARWRELPALAAALRRRDSAMLRALGDRIADFGPETESIGETLVEAPPIAVTEGGLVREGFSPEIDRWRSLSRGAKEWIARFQSEEREKTGIGNLRVGFNRVFGYYLEVTRGNREMVPANYERRQTLTGAERYVTPELKEREAEILGADERARALEHEIFLELRERIATA